MNFKYKLLLISSSLIINNNIQAQVSQVNRADTAKTLEEVVVSGSKANTKIAIQQISKINVQRIQQLNTASTADLLQQSGAVFMQKSQAGGGSPIIRGFEASRVLLMIDGVRMNNAIYRAGHLQNIITVDQNILQSVEVLNGPASVLYGSDALGGVVVMNSKNPQLSGVKNKCVLHANAMLRYASAAAEKAVHASINFGTYKFGLLSTITFTHFNNFTSGRVNTTRYGDWGKNTFYVKPMVINGLNYDSVIINSKSNIQYRTGYSQIDGMQKLMYQANKSLRYIAQLQYSNSSNINRYDRLSEKGSNGKPTFAEWYYGPQQRLMASVQSNYNNKSSFINRANITIAQQYIQESRLSRRLNSTNKREQVENIRVGSIDANVGKDIGVHQFTIGVDGQFNNLSSVANNYNVNTKIYTPTQTRYSNGRNQMNYYNLYAEHVAQLFNKVLMVQEGIRLTNTSLYSTIADNSFLKLPVTVMRQKSNAFTYSLGTRLNFTDAWAVKAQHNTGFRTPNFDDLSKVFETNGNTGVIIPNTTLKPEYTSNFELSTTYTSKTIKTQIGVYHTQFKNAMVVDKYKFNGADSIIYDGKPTQVLAMQNKGEAYVRGLFATADVNITRQILAGGSINFTKGIITSTATETPLDHIPPTYGNVYLQYKQKQWFAEVFTHFADLKPIAQYNLGGEDNQVYATAVGMPSWYTLNCRAQYSLGKYASVALGLDNILNKHYRFFASGISAQGRNLSITLRSNF
jgi:hemoglobin/transferrin/lactoferrin receptor protein